MMYTSLAVSEILGVHQKTVNYYYTKHGIGNKMGDRLYFYDTDIEKIKELMHDRHQQCNASR